ncbi:hypothetical protein HG531_009005 [Fusarium graminearum]|nr:hypothetical protein HG531_009005 [Fusarium graminearum]
MVPAKRHQLQEFIQRQFLSSDEVRGVESKSHKTSTDKTGDGDGHDPGEDEKENSLPVDSLDAAVAETDTNGGTSDTHGGGDGELVLREDEDSDGSTHLHGGTTTGRVVDHSGDNTNLPQRNLGLLLGRSASGPSSVHTSPDTDSVTDIVGTVLNLVGVLGSMLVDAGHTATFGSGLNTHLGSMNVVVSTVEESDDDLGGNALENGDQVVSLVDRTGTNGVGVESSHGPAKRSLTLAEVGVVDLLSILDHSLIVLLGRLRQVEVSFLVVLGAGGSSGGNLIVAGLLGVVLLSLVRDDLHVRTVLDNSVVGDTGVLGIRRSGAAEEKRSSPGIPPAEGVVLLDDNSVDEGDEEDGRHEEETPADTESESGDVPSRLLSETETGRSLVHNGECADGTSNEEEEGRGPDSPLDGVLADMHDILDKQEDDGSKDTGNGRSHTETSKDGTETLTTVPAPLNLASTNGSDTDTSERRDERVCRRDVGVVLCAPHNPCGSTGGGTGESEKLDTGVVAEGFHGDDTVLDGRGGSGADGQGAEHFEDAAKHHGSAIVSVTVGIWWWGWSQWKRNGRLTGTIVVGLKQSKATANGKDDCPPPGPEAQSARVSCLYAFRVFGETIWLPIAIDAVILGTLGTQWVSTPETLAKRVWVDYAAVVRGD